MRAGQIETTAILQNPLDVLAQQIVAMVAMEPWPVDALHTVIRRSAPFARLSRAVLDSVLDLLSGRYPSDEFAELRPRIDWDRTAGILTGRRGAQRLAVTSGGTIPDRGLYGVFLADGPATGRRVGELDEEMVFESRVGDTITLGSSSWLITEITNDQVLVAPAPGSPGRLPFWKGDGLGRAAELGQAIGAFVREVGAAPEAAARARLGGLGLDEWAADNLLTYFADQRRATGTVPDDQTIVVESFRDELGDWRIVVCSPYGGRVNTPWSLLIAASLRRAYGLDVQTMATDDGIVFRLPDTAEGWDADAPAAWARDGLTEHVLVAPEHVEDLVKKELVNSSHFAVRFREGAARALLLPRRQPGRRQPLWQLRNRAAQLLQVASHYPQFPIMLEAGRECLRDDFELDALADLMARIARREVRVVEITTPKPSPFARTVLFNYVGLFMYEEDVPLAELRATALTVDPTLLAELLGSGAGLDPADLLDHGVLTMVESELQCLTPTREARSAEDVHDLIRRLGPIDEAELVARTDAAVGGELATWLTDLKAAGQIVSFWRPRAVASAPGSAQPYSMRWVAATDAGLVAAALGVTWPPGLPEEFLEAPADPVGRLILRYARTHAPFSAEEVAEWLSLDQALVAGCLEDLVAANRLVGGNLRPADWRPVTAWKTKEHDLGAPATVYCDPDVLAQLRRRSMSKLRAEVEPVPGEAYARFLPGWHGIGDRSLQGIDALSRAVEQLAGVAVPASALETFILPARVADYDPGQLDELLAGGEILWCGRGELAGGDGWMTLLPTDLAEAFPGPGDDPPVAATERNIADALARTADDMVLEILAAGGAFRLSEIVSLIAARFDVLTPAVDVAEACWRLAWAGRVTTDTLAPLRSRLGASRPTVRSRQPPPRSSSRRPRIASPRVLASPRLRPGAAGGRWFLVPGTRLPATPAPALDATAAAERIVARAEILLDRYGILTRGSVRAEDISGGFAGIYRVLSLAEEQGRVRRGYFIDRLGGSQFAIAGAVDRLRSYSDTGSAPQAIVLAAADPANPYGAALPWPARPGDDLTSDDGAGAPEVAIGRPEVALGLPAGGPDSGGNLPAAGRTAEARGHRPSRKAGALVVLVNGFLAAFVERGGRTIMTWTSDPETLGAVATALAATVRDGRLDTLTVTAIDGQPVLLPKSAAGLGPLNSALRQAGFVLGPHGLRLRR
jgi:ATP-dependent Lhr-like helicase